MATDPEAVFELAVQLIIVGVFLYVFYLIFSELWPLLVETGAADVVANAIWKAVVIVVAAILLAYLIERSR